jgi:uncharacterized protein YyaL (SSP411 family)
MSTPEPESTQPPGQRPGNRLSEETSPYLLQHVHNPVDWYPWGKEAVSRAAELDRPIFLSVGYSACHWCHVMERESFEDEGIAGLLNTSFVAIKVDREERPDIDQVYMNSVQLLTRRGGWPMSVFMTPDGRPFFGGTYWPPAAAMGMPGFADILGHVAEAWTTRRDELERAADELAQAVRQVGRVAGADQAPDGSEHDTQQHSLDATVLDQVRQALLAHGDREHGGFGAAPKFPHSMDIRLLLKCHSRFADQNCLELARLTLDRMAGGGLYDQLGGGFHRYSTDAVWLVPHFEKMLYDNALLVPCYLEAYEATGEPRYGEIVRETLDWVLREMTSPEGGFYATQDADSEGEEGKFFVWSEAEVKDTLVASEGQAAADAFCDFYQVTPQGNWEGATILNRPTPLAEAAQTLGLAEKELAETLERCRVSLLEVRGQRIAPDRDDKILVAWNGMMITAMAHAARVLAEPRYRQAAEAAARDIWDRVRDTHGRLGHSTKDNQPRFPAFLDDVTCLLDGLCELAADDRAHDRADDKADEFLGWAVELAEQLLEHFGGIETDSDDVPGGFFFTPDDGEQLIARYKHTRDNATPSGNGMAATALLKLYRLTGEDRWRDAALDCLTLMSSQWSREPLASGQALLSLDDWLGSDSTPAQ